MALDSFTIHGRTDEAATHEKKRMIDDARLILEDAVEANSRGRKILDNPEIAAALKTLLDNQTDPAAPGWLWIRNFVRDRLDLPISVDTATSQISLK